MKTMTLMLLLSVIVIVQFACGTASNHVYPNDDLSSTNNECRFDFDCEGSSVCVGAGLCAECRTDNHCDETHFCYESACIPRPAEPTNDLILVEAGSFIMGAPDWERGRDEDETQHSVTITRDYYLQTHEVTQNEWTALMGNNPSNFFGCGGRCPVERVNWYEALAYANELSREQGLQMCYELTGCRHAPGDGMRDCSVVFAGLDCEGFRLPTEAEWEYAARAGLTTPLTHNQITSTAWHRSNADEHTHPVGQLQPNPWGFYDMLGNVQEWVSDTPSPYPTDDATDPLAAVDDQHRIRRGGSYRSFYLSVRFADRSDAFASSRGREFSTGFRLARTASPSQTVENNAANMVNPVATDVQTESVAPTESNHSNVPDQFMIDNVAVDLAEENEYSAGGWAGGSVEVYRRETDTGPCRGWTPDEPNHILVVHQRSFIRISVASRSDTTLSIEGPDGTFCSDDVHGFNPQIEAELSTGTYRIWVGTYSQRAAQRSPEYTIHFILG